ncbi:MAG: hypothetical protein ABSH03_08035 [Candidatus Lustribacter sp.]
MASPDILVQIHIPKCAGTSVGVWLRNAALDGVISGFRALYPDHVYAENEQPVGFHDPRLTAVTTHNIRRFAPISGGRRVHYFTLLRDPVTQFLSAARYMLQEREAFGVPSSVGWTPRDIAAWVLDQPLDAPFRDNNQTNHLAMYVWCDATAGRCQPEARETWAASDRAAYERERLAIAKDVLRSFLVVGTVERITESLELVRRRSTAFGLQLPPVEKLGRHNVTAVPVGDRSWIENDPIGVRLRESVAVDHELYLFAQQLLDEARRGSATESTAS